MFFQKKICLLFSFTLFFCFHFVKAQLFLELSNFKYSYGNYEMSMPSVLWENHSSGNGIGNDKEYVSLLFNGVITVYNYEKKYATQTFLYLNKDRGTNKILLYKDEIIVLNGSEVLFFNRLTNQKRTITFFRDGVGMCIADEKLFVAESSGELKQYDIKTLKLGKQQSIASEGIRDIFAHNQKIYFLESTQNKGWFKTFDFNNKQTQTLLEINNGIYTSKIEFDKEHNRVLFRSFNGLNLFDLKTKQNLPIFNPWHEYTNYGFLKDKIFISTKEDVAFYSFTGLYLSDTGNLMYWKYNLSTCYKVNEEVLRFFDRTTFNWIDYNVEQKSAKLVSFTSLFNPIGACIFSKNGQNICLNSFINNDENQLYIFSLAENKMLNSFKNGFDRDILEEKGYAKTIASHQADGISIFKEYNIINVDSAKLIKTILPEKKHSYSFNSDFNLYNDFSWETYSLSVKDMSTQEVIDSFTMKNGWRVNSTDGHFFLNNKDYYVKYNDLTSNYQTKNTTKLQLINLKSRKIEKEWYSTKHKASNTTDLYLQSEDTLKIYNFSTQKTVNKAIVPKNSRIILNKDYTLMLAATYIDEYKYHFKFHNLVTNQVLKEETIVAPFLTYNDFLISPNNKTLIRKDNNVLNLYDLKTFVLIGQVAFIIKNNKPSLVYIGNDGIAEGDEDYVRNGIKLLNPDGTYSSIGNRVKMESGILRKLLLD